MTNNRLLRTITDLQPGDHLGFLYQTEAEHQALLTPFLRQGLERGEKVLFIVDADPTETILDYLRVDGLEVEPYLARGQLRLMTPADTYLRTGVFNPDDMIAFWRTETERALAEGYQALRAAGGVTWAVQDLPGSERLLEYESMLSAFLPGTKFLVVCLYDWRRLGPEMLLSMLTTHPTAAVGTDIYDNFYYLSPTDLVKDRLPMAVLRYWLETLVERKRAEAEIHRQAARMEALAEISQALAEVGLDGQAILDTIARHTAEVIGDACVIRLLSSDEQWFKVVAFHHPKPEVKALMRLLHHTTPVSASNEWLAQILRTGQSLLIPIVTQEQVRQRAQPEYLPFFEQVGLHSVLIVPLRVEGRVIGTLGLSRDQPGHPYTLDDQVFLQALADRAALTLQNAQLFEQVQGAHERLQALSRRLLEVQEAERRHIARELHDEIGQVLTGLKLLLDMSVRLPAKTVKSHLAKAQALANELLERVDELSLNLRPPMLDDLGLLLTLLGHFERYTQQTHIQVTFQQTGLEGQRFSPDIEITVYRLIQEALTNVARHAGVGEVTVRLWVGQDTLGVEIEDRGAGFDPLATGASTGLSGMRERVVLLGGQLTIESSPGSGTSITAEVPLPISPKRSDANDDDRSGG